VSIAYFLFHDRLNDFLQREQKNRPITTHFRGRQSIKHLVESLGVPHPEVGEIRVNGQDESISRITQDEDDIDVYPIENGCSIEPRFLLDCHLGRLTAYLRMLGFDCLYQNDYGGPQMAEIVQQEERILLTRDRRLLMRKTVLSGYCLRSLNPLEQLSEVIARFEMKNNVKPFHRCIRCNHPLEPVAKDVILERLEPLTKQYFNEFKICHNCNQIYWKGSHYAKMQGLIKQVVNL
jgi:uncharacterized protein with PIN domain